MKYFVQNPVITHNSSNIGIHASDSLEEFYDTIHVFSVLTENERKSRGFVEVSVREQPSSGNRIVSTRTTLTDYFECSDRDDYRYYNAMISFMYAVEALVLSDVDFSSIKNVRQVARLYRNMSDFFDRPESKGKY